MVSHAVIHKGKGEKKITKEHLDPYLSLIQGQWSLQQGNDPTCLESKVYPFFMKQCNLSPLGTLCYYPANTKQIKLLDLS